ncbi:hypothetical protein QBC47DRAFT_47656 [Echria macrotheca]|uniref:Uncharacterized protein n=1 Tax=Echria macrotheca TaxID=438768 RepID=A0AAJ0BAI7_9PEZI|nr:hypothetical protein QBC47DRAFT_47656 [Echria macrotheca]
MRDGPYPKADADIVSSETWPDMHIRKADGPALDGPALEGPALNDPASHAGLVARIGRISSTLLVFSFPVCFGCLGFLSFLWVADSTNPTWQKIILAGWATRSITITSLALRWATTVQATLCTSMLAAILLQRDAVPLSSAAAVSLFRFDNTGPWPLLSNMVTQQRRVFSLIGLLVGLLSITTLALQFASTALLSQVGQAVLPVPTTVAKTLYAADPDGFSFGSQLSSTPSFLATTPAGFPAFAEWISDGGSPARPPVYGEFAPSSGPGIADTGTVMRAFLPIRAPEERSRLTEYRGFGTVLDTRVVCMRPKLTDAVYSTGSGFQVRGLIEPDVKPPGLWEARDLQGGTNFSRPFNCDFAAAAVNDYTVRHGWPLAICIPSFGTGTRQGIPSVMDPDGRGDLRDEYEYTYILINATMSEYVTTLDGSDVWQTLSLQAVDYDKDKVTLQITLCMTAIEGQEMEIEATRPTPIPPEPILSWNTSVYAYDAAAVLRQLGAGPSSPAERGILALTRRSSWKWPTWPESLSLTGGGFSTTFALETMRSLYSSTSNAAQYTILAQMGRDTRNPALALQAFLTTLCAVCYYDRISLFDVAAPSDQVTLVQVTRPLEWPAFIAVAGVVVLHLLLVLLVIVVFCVRGRLSRIGNAWSSVAQLLGPTTEGWIRDVNGMDDRAVESWLRVCGMDKALVGVEQVGGRAQLVEKVKKS